MDKERVKAGIRVEIVELYSTAKMSIDESHLDVRKKGIKGTVVSQVPKHWDFLWLVQHDGSEDVGAYAPDEFEQIFK